MKTSKIVTAVENGAEWECKHPDAINNPWNHPSSGSIQFLYNRLSYGYEVRLKPQKKTVPLGPEDWDGVWWISDWADYSHRYMVISIDPRGVDITRNGANCIMYYDGVLMENYKRSKDCKTWTPCSKEI